MHHTPVSPGAPERRLDARRRAGRLVGAVLVIALASCGGSSGSDSAPATSTTTTATTETTGVTTSALAEEAEEAEGDEVADDEPTGSAGRAAMPTDEDDAPSGDWIMIRYLTGQEPEPEVFTAGQAEVRLYTIEPECDDACDLTIGAGGEDGAFNLEGLTPLTGDPFEAEAGDEAWTTTYDEEPYGCTPELDGPYVSSRTVAAFAPVRDDGGDLVAMVGSVTFTDETTPEGEAAGCPETSVGVYEYDTVYLPAEQFGALPDFEVDGSFVATLEVTDSEGYTEELMQEDAISTTFEEYRYAVGGSCEDGACDIDVEIPLGGGNGTRQVTLAADGDDALAGSFEDSGGCYDPATDEIVFPTGAYDDAGTLSDVIPLLVVDGEAQMFLGRYAATATPTELGRTHAACSTPQTFEGWTTWVAADLVDG